MSIAVTVVSVANLGARRLVEGTFTTTDGDSSLQMSKSDHGLNEIALAQVSLDVGGVAVQNPKITIAADVVTMLWDDTQGYSGRFSLIGR